jgi:hypothetical protein
MSIKIKTILITGADREGLAIWSVPLSQMAASF